MLSYWDLSEKERSALSEADVEKFIAGELMRKGVLKVKPLELLPEPPTVEPDVTLYVPSTKERYGTRSDVGFPSREVAVRAVAADAHYLSNEYIGGKSIQVATPPTAATPAPFGSKAPARSGRAAGSWACWAASSSMTEAPAAAG